MVDRACEKSTSCDGNGGKGDATVSGILRRIDGQARKGDEDVFGSGSQRDFAPGLATCLFDDTSPPECLESGSP